MFKIVLACLISAATAITIESTDNLAQVGVTHGAWCQGSGGAQCGKDPCGGNGGMCEDYGINADWMECCGFD